MSNIHDEIKRLQHKAAVIDYAKAVAEAEEPFGAINSATPEAKDEVVAVVRNFLLNHAMAVEQGVVVDDDIKLSREDVMKLKMISCRLDASVKTTETNVKKDTPPVARSTPTPKSTARSADRAFPRKATIIDTQYITNAHGELPGIYCDMPITIVGEVDAENYIGSLTDRTSVSFSVPKDCVQLT